MRSYLTGSFLIARMKVRYSPNHYLLLLLLSTMITIDYRICCFIYVFAMNTNKDAGYIINFIFIITTTTLCLIQAIDITVMDNENENGVNNPSCLAGIIPCLTLDYVFSHLSDCHNTDIAMCVSLLKGNHKFTLNSTITGHLFKNCPAIIINGIGCYNTSIVCGVDAGFAFQNIPLVKIANITFTNCGALRNSTSVNLSIVSPNTTMLLSTALYFAYCKNVQIVW